MMASDQLGRRSLPVSAPFSVLVRGLTLHFSRGVATERAPQAVYRRIWHNDHPARSGLPQLSDHAMRPAQAVNTALAMVQILLSLYARL